MSTSGGYYKYRCKYWLTHDCPHWVWVNNAPCAHCLADGRDSDVAVMPVPFRRSREVYVPRFQNGALSYTLMEVFAVSDYDSGWVVKEPPMQSYPIATEPSAVNMTVTDGIDSQKAIKTGLQIPVGGGWMGSGAGIE